MIYKNHRTKWLTLRHYMRMRRWVRTQDPEGTSLVREIIEGVGEHWGGADCPYCREYRADSSKGCKLGIPSGYCASNECCAGKWSLLGHSPTWGEWLTASTEVMYYIIKNG